MVGFPTVIFLPCISIKDIYIGTQVGEDVIIGNVNSDDDSESLPDSSSEEATEEDEQSSQNDSEVELEEVAENHSKILEMLLYSTYCFEVLFSIKQFQSQTSMMIIIWVKEELKEANTKLVRAAKGRIVEEDGQDTVLILVIDDECGN